LPGQDGLVVDVQVVISGGHYCSLVLIGAFYKVEKWVSFLQCSDSSGSEGFSFQTCNCPTI
jgi:hypothetical protein